MSRSKVPLAVLMGLVLGGGAYLPERKRTNNKLPFTDEELATLETLSGKEKKIYVKELRNKYASRAQTAHVPGPEMEPVQPHEERRHGDEDGE